MITAITLLRAGITLLILSSVGLAGCGYPTLYVTNRDGSRPEAQKFDRDVYECDRESITYGGGSGIAGAIAISQARKEARRLYIACLKARGYSVSEEAPK